MFKKTLLLTSSVALLSASTTMCFKKEHIDPSTIETVKLEGGECGGKLTAQDMQRNGYEVGDIKISSGENGLNYIYIFKKGQQQLAQTTLDGKYILTKEDLKAKFAEFQEEERIENQKKQRVANIAAGKIKYEMNCQECHGEKGEKSAYGVSKPLNTLSLDYMQGAIRDYVIGEKSDPMAILMKPYAVMTKESDVENIHSYLQSINKEETHK